MEKTHTMPDGTVMPGASHSPTEMMQGIDPITGMPVNQMQQSPINPMALGGLQNQIPNIVGQPNPTQSFNNTMPENSPLADKDHASKNRSTKETREHARAHLREYQKNKREVLRKRNINNYTKNVKSLNAGGGEIIEETSQESVKQNK